MTQNVSGWLPNLIGPVEVQDDGTAVTARAALNFIGFDVADNPTYDRVDLTPDLANKTLASPTITGTVIHQGTKLRILSIPGEASTSGVATVTVASFSQLDETTAALDVVVTCTRKVNATKAGRFKRSVMYRRTGAGVSAIVGALESGTDEETDAGLDVTIDTDGAHLLRVRATGIATDDFNWGCELRVQELLAT